MLNHLLARFYERDLRKLIEEINLFKNEEDLWKTQGTITNTSGNLALHITGGLNHYYGTVLARNGYVRDRPLEFSKKNVPRKEIIAGLEALIPLITGTLNAFTEGQMEEPFPINFDGASNSNNYVLVQLLVHLNYHTGQVNYLRRSLE